MKGKFACVYSNLYVLFLFILQNEPNGVRLGRRRSQRDRVCRSPPVKSPWEVLSTEILRATLNAVPSRATSSPFAN